MRAGSPNKVVILDRDGTIVVDRGYLADPDGLEFIPEAPEALRWLWERECRLVVITNQSGVGRGFFSIDCVEAMNARLHAMIEGAGAKLERIYFCPHTPEANCACRKPRLALMEQAATELNFRPRSSVVVGDKESDVEFGLRAGARAILISSETENASAGIGSSLTVRNLMEAARAITDPTGAFVQHTGTIGNAVTISGGM
jgi:D-glycero-D-manno-heptose 1,7-bisphosphate phosphatase